MPFTDGKGATRLWRHQCVSLPGRDCRRIPAVHAVVSGQLFCLTVFVIVLGELWSPTRLKGKSNFLGSSVSLFTFPKDADLDPAVRKTRADCGLHIGIASQSQSPVLYCRHSLRLYTPQHSSQQSCAVKILSVAGSKKDPWPCLLVSIAKGIPTRCPLGWPAPALVLKNGAVPTLTLRRLGRGQSAAWQQWWAGMSTQDSNCIREEATGKRGRCPCWTVYL